MDVALTHDLTYGLIRNCKSDFRRSRDAREKSNRVRHGFAPVVNRTYFSAKEAAHMGDAITDESIEGLGHPKKFLLRLKSWPRSGQNATP